MSKLMKTYLYGLPIAGYYYSLSAQRKFNHRKQKSLEYNLWVNGKLKASDFPNLVASEVASDVQKIRQDISYDWLNNTLSYPKNILWITFKYCLSYTDNYFLTKDYDQILKLVNKK